MNARRDIAFIRAATTTAQRLLLSYCAPSAAFALRLYDVPRAGGIALHPFIHFSNPLQAHQGSRSAWSQAAAHYREAARVVCTSGNPFNQLAVLSYYLGDELRAVSYYFRSLAVAQPFATSRENLLILFEKNRAKLGPPLDAAVTGGGGAGGAPRPGGGNSASNTTDEAAAAVAAVARTAKDAAAWAVRLHGSLFDRINSEQLPAVNAAAFERLSALLHSDDLPTYLQARASVLLFLLLTAALCQRGYRSSAATTHQRSHNVQYCVLLNQHARCAASRCCWKVSPWYHTTKCMVRVIDVTHV